MLCSADDFDPKEQEEEALNCASKSGRIDGPRRFAGEPSRFSLSSQLEQSRCRPLNCLISRSCPCSHHNQHSRVLAEGNCLGWVHP